jgi:hypothetical protein
MAKGKGGSGKTYTSKGERRSSMKTPNRDPGQRMLNQMAALAKGKDVVFTMENPNKNETNKRFIKVKVSGKDFLKSSKSQGYMMKSSVGGE